ncbi:UPF0126 inner membrane protein YadS [Alteripontixanthobacter maritimus]|uniref:UPF0126 inner membrane protein YadS n=1 Tax=Alteripontixanthobacter maritimus TaxID=2161824 RepID=A0A369QAI9_9SPHN|nr:trimeric intracellular cation channel family protein [Alteripontixanthobacter maritimus]RDC60257.1 UPF0126 inner membrane protein YadS [Alteripontixanthobacter maritimus]
MNPIVLTPLLDALDLIGVAVFALSGALLAAKMRQTFVTMAFFAMVTGTGGGTIRDVLIGAPVFWIVDPWVATICLAVAVLAWFTPSRWWDGKLLDYSDGAGLAAYAVLGTAKALSYDLSPIPAVLMGVATGCAGGIIRDVVAGRPSIIVRPELYVTAAAFSATLTVAGDALALPRVPVWIGAATAGFILRAAAIRFSLALPAYRKDAQPSDGPE